MKINGFEDLPVWKSAILFLKEIYRITGIGDFSKDWSLKDQIRRASISISSNIVEGFEKSNNNELIRFLLIAKGSLGEVKNQLIIAKEIEYISTDEYAKIRQHADDLSKQIGGFVNYLCDKRKAGEFKPSKK